MFADSARDTDGAHPVDRTAALGLLVLCVTLYIYLPLKTAGYVYEDFGWRDALGLNTEWSLTLTGKLFHDQAWAFHAGNVLLHLLNGLLLALSVKAVWGIKTALLSAAIFLWHPLNSEAVSYVAARPDLLSAFWLLLACWLALCFERADFVRSLLIVGCAALAMIAKPSSVVVLGLIPLMLCVTGRIYLWVLAVPAWAAMITTAATRAIGIWQNPYTFQSHLGPKAYISAQGFTLLTLLSRFFTLQPVGVEVEASWLAALGCISVTWFVYLFWPRFQKPILAACAWIILALWPRFMVRSPELLHAKHLPTVLIGLSVALAYSVISLWETACEKPSYS